MVELKDAIKTNIFKISMIFLFWGYSFILVYVVMFKCNYHGLVEEFKMNDFARIQQRFLNYSNFEPLKMIKFYLRGKPNITVAAENLLGNIIVFMPLGFLLAAINRKYNKIYRIFVISFLVSLVFEFIQLITGIGSFDVDDLLLNITGGILGLLVFKSIKRGRKY